jgi:hypothetical protein
MTVGYLLESKHKEGKKERKGRERERERGSGANSAKERGEKEWKGGDPDNDVRVSFPESLR